jgi:hypothetical protein
MSKQSSDESKKESSPTKDMSKSTEDARSPVRDSPEPDLPPQTASSISMAQDRRENVKTEDDSTGTNFFARGNVPLLPNPRLQFLSPVANGNDQLQRLCLYLGILSVTFYLDPPTSTPLYRKCCSNTSFPTNNMC